jgi:hypothetical protein
MLVAEKWFRSQVSKFHRFKVSNKNSQFDREAFFREILKLSNLFLHVCPQARD